MSEKQFTTTEEKSPQTGESSDRQIDHATQQKQDSALKDKSTGLYKRAYFQHLINKEAVKAHRYHRPISLILFSLDHFSQINGRFGQPDSGLLLKRLGSTVRRNIREADSACCFEQGTFAILLPETNLEGALTMADRLRQKVEQMQVNVNNGTAFGVTISAGVSTWERQFNTNNKSSLITAASQALNQAKDQGRNRVINFRRAQ